MTSSPPASAPLTASVRRRLDAGGHRAARCDVYAGDGVRFYDALVGADRSEIHEILTVARACGPRVLDLAAGSGRVTLPLLRVGKTVTALDLSTDMLDRLRAVLAPGARCELVAADMRDADLGRRFDLVVLAATSITLLGAEDRARLFATVRRHLAAGGRFVLSIAGPTAARALAVSADRVIDVPRSAEGGPERFLQSQEVDPATRTRVVNWMPFTPAAAGDTVPVLTTRLHLLDSERLMAELAVAGFAVPDVIPVRGRGVAAGEGLMMLRTSDPQTPAEADRDA